MMQRTACLLTGRPAPRPGPTSLLLTTALLTTATRLCLVSLAALHRNQLAATTCPATERLGDCAVVTRLGTGTVVYSEVGRDQWQAGRGGELLLRTSHGWRLWSSKGDMADVAEVAEESLHCCHLPFQATVLAVLAAVLATLPSLSLSLATTAAALRSHCCGQVRSMPWLLLAGLLTHLQLGRAGSQHVTLSRLLSCLDLGITVSQAAALLVLLGPAAPLHSLLLALLTTATSLAVLAALWLATSGQDGIATVFRADDLTITDVKLKILV